MMFLDATRISDKVPFGTPPIQSDYRRKWRQSTSPDASAGGFEYVPIWEELRRRFRQHRKSSLRNRRFFEPLDPMAEG